MERWKEHQDNKAEQDKRGHGRTRLCHNGEQHTRTDSAVVRTDNIHQRSNQREQGKP